MLWDGVLVMGNCSSIWVIVEGIAAVNALLEGETTLPACHYAPKALNMSPWSYLLLIREWF